MNIEIISKKCNKQLLSRKNLLYISFRLMNPCSVQNLGLVDQPQECPLKDLTSNFYFKSN